ncbi:hypothetical protein DFJ74DRAFT_671730 [Hyaloraphidium curvatum]|nr:hypothetical protein DFJ74DRAFT_671730 [Hyaloraphidium curvatum]
MYCILLHPDQAQCECSDQTAASVHEGGFQPANFGWQRCLGLQLNVRERVRSKQTCTDHGDQSGKDGGQHQGRAGSASPAGNVRPLGGRRGGRTSGCRRAQRGRCRSGSARAGGGGCGSGAAEVEEPRVGLLVVDEREPGAPGLQRGNPCGKQQSITLYPETPASSLATHVLRSLCPSFSQVLSAADVVEAENLAFLPVLGCVRDGPNVLGRVRVREPPDDGLQNGHLGEA